MTVDLTLDPPRQAGRGRKQAMTNQGASYLVASTQVAGRTLKKFVRSPALIVAGTAQGVLFLLIFRYVFGGAIAHTGSLDYVDFLVPGFVVTGAANAPAVGADGPTGACTVGRVGPGMTWFGTTVATAELPASVCAWLAVALTTIAFTRLVEPTSRPPTEWSWDRTGFCSLDTAVRRAADCARMPEFWLCKITMYCWAAPPAEVLD